VCTGSFVVRGEDIEVLEESEKGWLGVKGVEEG
jgi:hypothetical protein